MQSLPRTMRTPISRALLMGGVCALLCSACKGSGSSSTTTPSTPTTPTPITETFSGTLPVGGAQFYSFGIATAGTVNVTLVSVSIGDQPSDVSLTVGIGTPSGITCSSTNQSAVTAGTTPQVTGSQQPGVYCVTVQDVGPLLPAPAAFTVTIAHP